MSLSDLASVGTFLSALGVLISLIYLSAQVRQATKHQRALMLESRTTRVVDWQMRVADPGLAPLWHKLLTGAHDLTEVETSQLALVFRANLTTGEATYLQHEEGLVGDRAFESMRKNWVTAFSWPANRVLWKAFHDAYDPAFAAWIDDQLGKAVVNSRPISAQGNRFGLTGLGVRREANCDS